MALAAASNAGAQAGPTTRPIPSTGERLPAVGLGTWLTFDVGSGESNARGEVLKAFFAAGGHLVDSSPMYGASEEVIGAQYARIGKPAAMFSATKVWTVGGLAGRRQMEKSRGLWNLPRFDLMQVHNYLDWETHLPTLKAMKAEGKLRYVGVTTSHGRRHDLAEEIMKKEKLDFFQVTYSLADPEADKRLLPLAADRGTAVIINRPFDGGALFSRVKGKALPGWAAEIGCKSWAEVFLKWIVSHPAVTCAIPATTRVDHVRENMGALAGPLPDAAMRRRISADFHALSS
ncbi:NADH-specific methylglyoxal reductase [Usitatibacter palustris]|uniref:NADH-specific methylglyoxal reductase n=2 Tax=Usitatibacter palustris TaxID=2732487 RepID=A0A6M4H1P2_9PROT|nr:NADH-specific methylglyoxal reductase [Usitatibacter palustris]